MFDIHVNQKITYGLRIISFLGAFLILAAIFLTPRGDTFEAAKAALKAQYQLDTLEGHYLLTLRGRNIAIALPKVFYNQTNRYSMRYPDNWTQDESKSIFIVNGKEGTTSFLSNVNIQIIRTQLAGGFYASAHDFINSMKQHAGGQANIRIVDSGPIVLYLLDGTPVKGEYLIFTYSLSGLAFKQWQVAVKKDDGQVIYVWAYNAPLATFQTDYPIAQAMLKSVNLF